MANSRSFTEVVKDKCYDRLFKATENYIDENWESMDLYTKHVHRIGSVELSEIYIRRVYVEDLPSSMVKFDVGLELELYVREGNYHYDGVDICSPWLRIECEGDLDTGLEDWQIISIREYSKKNFPPNSMSDALVPRIAPNELEDVATSFLKEYYPEALKVTGIGEPPISVDPRTLAERLSLSVQMKRIREDASVFGQLYFAESEVSLYDENTDSYVETHIPAKTILVDPLNFLLRNLGSVNNTIVHECVHWVKHRKVFALEKICNKNASHISCEVVGGAESPADRTTTKQMERQANALAPRIQMPAVPFRAKANEYISKYLKTDNSLREIDVMEQVIEELSVAFVVSKQAAKIRMVELGFEKAVGTFTYLDNHYVQPHCFKKGALKVNQTFSISAQDAAIQRAIDPVLRGKVNSGDYLFVDNHYVYNAPLYVTRDEMDRLVLTDYARTHMDECCLIFDLSIRSDSGVSQEYHSICFLNREDNNVTFEVKFHNGYQNAPQERQIAMRQKERDEEVSIRKQMTDDPEQCMKLLLKWRGMKYTTLGDAIDRDPKTISRIVNRQTQPDKNTCVRICFGLRLPPSISEKLLDVLHCPLSRIDSDDQWIQEALNIKYPEPINEVERYLGEYGVEI